MVATVVATRARERAILNRRSRITAVDEATLVLLFQAPTFPVRAFAIRVKIPKDRLVGMRTGTRTPNRHEVRRLAVATVGPNPAEGAIRQREDLIWRLVGEAQARKIERERLEAQLDGGAS